MIFAFSNTLLVSLFLGAGFIALGLSVTENPADVGNSFSLFAYMLVTAVGMLLLLRFYKGKLLFKLFELSFVFISIMLAWSVFLGDEYAMQAGLVAALIRFAIPGYTQILLYCAAAIVGALLGTSLDIIPAALFAVMLSCYDYYAVFKSKHMITLAKNLNERGASFSVKTGSEDNRVELGLGDFVMGATLAVSALRISAFPDFGSALASAIGSSFGLSVLFYYLEKKRGYFPAVPPIAAGSLLCLAAYWGIKIALSGFLR